MPTPTTSTHCLRYWDLADHIRIDDAIALWCGVEPAELAKLNFETQCMSAKRAALVTALRDGRLGYEDLGLLTGQGKVFRGAPVDELIEKGRLVINKASLRRWFEQLPFDDRPAFLFEEERQPVLPDGSDVAEMTGLKAIALMAHLLASSSAKQDWRATERRGHRPRGERGRTGPDAQRHARPAGLQQEGGRGAAALRARDHNPPQSLRRLTPHFRGEQVKKIPTG